MDVATLKASQTYPGYSLPGEVNYAKLLPAVEHAMLLSNCNTVRRASGQQAQFGAESGSYRWLEELASGSDYEGRSDLGNTHAGDGRRFKGRGPIQLTGRHNYTVFSAWAYKNRAAVKRDFGITVPNKTYYVTHPQLLSLPNHGFLGAVYYWVKARNMNSYCDRDDIAGMTRAVNGGYNNLSGRTKRYRKCKSLGVRMLPGKPHPSPKPASKPRPVPKPKRKPIVVAKPVKSSPKTVAYVVKSGDTLASIALRLNRHGRRGVTWQSLRKLNRLKNANLIHVGQKIQVPRKAAR